MRFSRGFPWGRAKESQGTFASVNRAGAFYRLIYRDRLLKRKDHITDFLHRPVKRTGSFAMLGFVLIIIRDFQLARTGFDSGLTMTFILNCDELRVRRERTPAFPFQCRDRISKTHRERSSMITRHKNIRARGRLYRSISQIAIQSR